MARNIAREIGHGNGALLLSVLEWFPARTLAQRRATAQAKRVTEPRLMIDAALAQGVMLALDEAQARHVGQVLRRDVGDALRVFNAQDGEWHARVAEKSKRGMSVWVEQKLRDARLPPDLDLLFAPVKRHATDLIVEKATELGVRRIRPVITQRTIAETVRVDRLASIAREAAEQTERFDAPKICEPISLAHALDGWDSQRVLIYADEGGDAPPIAVALQTFSPLVGEVSRASATEGGPANTQVSGDEAFERPPPPAPQGGGGFAYQKKLALLIGPEGGFTTEERRMLRGLPFVTPISLGPRILRAETAVIAALSVIQAVSGDWRRA